MLLPIKYSSSLTVQIQIPLWFQAIKSVSPVKSGIMNLPMLLGFVIFSLMGGVLITIVGYYIPFVYLTLIFMSVGGGLLTTLEINSGSPKWIGYQFLFGAGSGLCMQQTMVILQTALPMKDIPIGTALVMFSQNLTGAIMVSVAQNVFTNQLAKNLSHYVPSINPSIILAAGATQIKSQVPEEFYDRVLIAYNKSLTQTFYVGVALSCCAAFGALGIQSLSVKEKNVDQTEME